MTVTKKGSPIPMRIIPALFGGLLGVLILHPYTMLVYRILLNPEPLERTEEVLNWVGHRFALHMWPMFSSFFLFGAVFGHGVGVLWDKKRELLEREAENERRKAIQETLQEITLTVAHYIRNSNSLIGGLTRRLVEKPPPEPELHEKLVLIQNASNQVEAVVASLKSLDGLVEKEDIGTTQLRMLDIRKAVARELQKSEGRQRGLA